MEIMEMRGLEDRICEDRSAFIREAEVEVGRLFGRLRLGG